MNRNDVLSVLRGQRQRLRSEYGVKSLALFGSIARNQGGQNSDVDLLVEFDRRISLLDLVGTAQYIETLLNLPEDKVDLVIRDAVIPELKEAIYGEAIDVFGEREMEVSHSAHS